MNSTDIRRFGGICRLYGNSVREKLAAAHVCVIGLGGVGSWCVEALARTGVGRLTLIDGDIVAESNINRQLPALTSTLGRPKAEVLAARAADINPEATIMAVTQFIDETSMDRLIPADALIVDVIDSLKAKTALIAWAHQQGRFILVSGGAGGRTNPALVTAGDLACVTPDALEQTAARCPGYLGDKLHDLALALAAYDAVTAQGHADPTDRFSVSCQGGYRALRHRDPRLVEEFRYSATAPTLQRARDITVDAIDDFKSGKLDEIYIVYTKIQNALTSEPVMERLLPLDRRFLQPAPKGLGDPKGEVELVPDAWTVFEQIAPIYMHGMIFGAMTESFCAEQSARMTAMDSATKSANDMIRDLQLEYNRTRQGSITQEITEIIGGASAVKSQE